MTRGNLSKVVKLQAKQFFLSLSISAMEARRVSRFSNLGEKHESSGSLDFLP